MLLNTLLYTHGQCREGVSSPTKYQTQILIHAKSWTKSLLHQFMPRVFLDVRTAQGTI